MYVEFEELIAVIQSRRHRQIYRQLLLSVSIISIIKSLAQLVHCMYNYPHYIMQIEDRRMQKKTNL